MRAHPRGALAGADSASARLDRPPARCSVRRRGLFSIVAKQAIRRGTFTSVNALIARVRDYVEHWNTPAGQFA
ncbi:hypothetical protein GCM10022225_77430 [Plantactinospora mayteni]|uniref:Integrase catalytic domain-containing protein n=1 Tax=Plantactinospora mayteni TaxID=566021 RepID=A0ABQ4F2N4_9ACTN|nr:hypothetical protein Pma05_77490 [Plantactinospora mayteni]